jgi:hypothetical protein
MKKILYTVLALGLTLTSCGMDEYQPGTKTDLQSLQTADDCSQFRNGFYSNLRAITSGDYVTYTDLEMDHFIGLRGNGSRGVTVNTAQINSATSAMQTIYGGVYSAMKNVNFFLDNVPELLENGKFTEAEATQVKRYIGEAKFVRAYFYIYLFDHFCQAYKPAIADTEGLGLQIQLTYDPTGVTSKYPGRSTMKETADVINNDLQDAYDALKEYEETDASQLAPNASYLSSMAVAALQARWALLTQDYTTAISKAQEVINSGLYELASGNEYKAMWSDDNGPELIFVPYVDSSESANIGSFMDAFAYTAQYPTRVDYLPTEATLYQYDDNDVRFDAFFTPLFDMQIEDTKADAYVFYKFPGNPSLVSGTNEYKNKPKPFRLSEQYLILAEAAAATNQTAVANKALNDLRAQRITGYTEATYSGDALINQIREERDIELIGEGFRMSDLRRWGLGFSRSTAYNINPIVEDLWLSSSANTAFTAGDYRYTWPIPAREMQITPALAGQQNPGY